MKHRDGSWRIVDGVATNLLHEPAVRGIVLNYRDVTPEREQERRLRDVEQRRQTLLEDIINAEAQQRSRIAEELHDDTIQVMAAALMELDRIERHLRLDDVDAARRAITSAREALTKATDRTRRLTFELRPQLLEAVGLGPAVRDLANALHRDTGVKVKVRTQDPPVSGRHRDAGLRTIREILINVRKHARAANVWISVVERRRVLHVRIRDDGRGFRMRPRPRASTHIGIETAGERVRAMTGDTRCRLGAGRGDGRVPAADPEGSLAAAHLRDREHEPRIGRVSRSAFSRSLWNDGRVETTWNEATVSRGGLRW